MKSNITLRSNVYINKTKQYNDLDFVHHIRDYNSLKKYYNPVYRKSEVPLTRIQYEMMDYGSPKCSLESGTMSWGVPIGSERFVCRCEKTDCSRYARCSNAGNFELIVRNPEDKLSLEYAKEADKEFDIEYDFASVPNRIMPSIDRPLSLSNMTNAVSPKETSEKPISENHPIENSTSTDFPYQSSLFDIPDFEENFPPQKTQQQTQPVEQASLIEFDKEVRAESVFENMALQTICNLTLDEDQTNTASEVTQDFIINADSNTRILVNAGPGTGKTYVVIKRLQKLLQSNDADRAILVLCFSKNAVHVIQERLRAEIGNMLDGLIADERLIIRTFDSFATYMLADELPKGLSYDQRIEQFIQSAADNTDALDNVEYIIVDEVQDTVGARARMLKSIIENSRCGILLLGDFCQAIYDWTARDNNDWTSDAFFTWVKSQNFQNYELGNNHRQTQNLSSLGDIMRQSLLHDNEDKQEEVLRECKTKIERTWPGYRLCDLPQNLTRNDELILCKTNGETAVISDLLFGRADLLKHTVLQGADHKSLAPWIGMILGGYTAPIMSKEEFVARAQSYALEDIDQKWDALISLDSHERSAVLHRKEVLMRLARMDALPEVCLNHPEKGIIVSTVHRAKGSEAEHVYWLDSPLVYENQESEGNSAKSDALKASYVAITRAKRDVRLIQPEKQYLRRITGDRWIKIGFSKFTRRKFCGGVAMQPEDVDLLSCASGPDAQEMQNVIAQLTPGLDVELYPSTDGTCFEIQFDSRPVGKTSSSFMTALLEGFRATNGNKNLPCNISAVYISSLVTVIQLGGTNEENDFQTSGCWLGYELGGFSYINYT